MPLGMELGLGPGNCVKWGPHSPSQKRTEPPDFQPMFIVAKRLDGSRRDLARLGDFVLDGDPALSPKGGRAPSPIFGPFLLWPNG